jgi:hypothetical protein
MNQKIFNNIILFFIVLYIIKIVSPQPDSVLYVFQKYLNYFIFKIKSIIANFGFYNSENFKSFNNTTLTGITKYKNRTPSFKTSHEVNYVKYFKKLNPNVSETKIYRLYNFIKNLISIDTEQNFSTPSDIIPNDFSENEKLKLQTIILNKLNSGTLFSFSEFNLEFEPKYYLNINGKEIDPFVFNVKSNIGKIRIYIDINIRNDVYENKEFVVINDIKPITDKNVVFSNQNVIYNIEVRPKIKKTPFTGDVNLIFTNNSIDDYNYNDIEVEKIPNISGEPVYNHSVNYYSKSQENVKDIVTTNNLFAYNEYDNLDFIEDRPIVNISPDNKNNYNEITYLKNLNDNQYLPELPSYYNASSISKMKSNNSSIQSNMKSNSMMYSEAPNSMMYSEAPNSMMYSEAPNSMMYSEEPNSMMYSEEPNSMMYSEEPNSMDSDIM